jgi:hypothetical protein
MSKPETDQAPASNWWEAYPTVKSSPALISPEEIAELLRANDENLAVIDVRRNDHAVRRLPLRDPPHIMISCG